MRSWLLVVLLAALLAAPSAAADFFLRDGQRVVFLGDSNTYAGGFIALVDYSLHTRHPERKVEFINLGLPSETVSGLSEPDHPYPRPCVFDRLQSALTKTKPDVVVVCYGMNDGIYYPPSPERLKAYQAGMEKLVARIEKAGAKVVLMTPAPFDPKPLGDKVKPAGARKFSWMAPYEGYDDVLGQYSEWLVTFRKKGYRVADAHTALRVYLAEVRKADPKFVVSGDGIHPSAAGHGVIARELLTALGADLTEEGLTVDGRTGKATRGKVEGVKVEKGSLSFTWTTPVPLVPVARREPRLLEMRVIDLPARRYALKFSGKKVVVLTAEELAKRIDLARFAAAPVQERMAEVLRLAEQKHQLLGLAWLTEVGHKRPGTPKGLPLEEAKKKAEEVQRKLRAAARPLKLEVAVERVGD